MTKYLNLLVISDLHACLGDIGSKDSHLVFSDGESEFGNSLIAFIASLSLDIDIVFCSGDIGNKGDIDSFKEGWRFVNKLHELIGAKDLVCVPGNHDHQSRLDEKVFSPKHNLQFISPIFPLRSKSKNTDFWAWNWCCTESENYNTILLNTSAYHGYGEECEHGRLATEVSSQIIESVKGESFKSKPINFIICHHHPVKMENVDENYDGEEIQGAQLLLSKIDEIDKGAWFVIHGHKHYPSISYANTSCSMPSTILSAGSLSAKLHDGIKNKTSNQFYIVQIDLQKTEDYGRAVGVFKTYEWSMGRGWFPSQSENLPGSGGFGSIYNPRAIAKEIANKISDESPFLDEIDLAEFSDKFRNFLPKDMRSLIDSLKSLGLSVEDDGFKIIQVGKTA